eukprot:9867874-Karenia_brevis.AAC.1
MPHSGYSDPAVEELYTDLSEELRIARKTKRQIILAGDWNAEVQNAATGSDDPKRAEGQYANSGGNQRGQWLTNWAREHKLLIANSWFKKRWGRRWTHKQNGRQRVIGYFCTDRDRRHQLLDSEVCRELDMNSDHRAIYLKLKLDRRTIR